MAVVLGCYKLGSEEVGAVEGEDAPAARQRVEQIGEVGFDGGAFVQEGEGQTPGRKVVGQALGVLGRLRLDAGEGGSFGLRFDGADGFAVDVEEVVSEAVAGLALELADGDAQDPASGDAPIGTTCTSKGVFAAWPVMAFASADSKAFFAAVLGNTRGAKDTYAS